MAWKKIKRQMSDQEEIRYKTTGLVCVREAQDRDNWSKKNGEAYLGYWMEEG